MLVPNRMIGSVVALATLFLAATEQGAAQEGEAQGNETQASAPGLYGGIDLTVLGYHIDSVGDPGVAPNGATIALCTRIGVRINAYLAAELHSGLGLNETARSSDVILPTGENFGRVDSVTKVNMLVNMRGRISIPTNKAINPYATLGVAFATATSDFGGVQGGSALLGRTNRGAQVYLSYGVGMNLKLPKYKNVWSYFEFTGYGEFVSFSSGIGFDL